jgi:predicted AAA+ superfamily ATPase
VQMGPDLFPIIRVAVDEDRRSAKFLMLGSASQDLIRQSSETPPGEFIISSQRHLPIRCCRI